MATHTFTLTDDKEHIALDTLLKLMRLVGSGGEAHAAIARGMVKVNGITETQKRKKVRPGDTAEFNGETIKVES